MSQRRSLVLGATGHLGNALLRELVAAGDCVTGVSRRPAANLAGVDARVVHGDIRDPELLASVSAGQQRVFHAAASYPLAAHDWAAVALARRTTHTLIEVLGGRDLEAVVYVGSFVTLDAARGGPQRTPGWLARAHPYFGTKRAIEHQLLAAVDSHRLPLVVGCPTACLGPWDCRPLTTNLGRQLLEAPLPLVADTDVNVLDVRDAARALRLLADRGSPGQRYLIAGNDTRAAVVIGALRRAAGRRAPPVWQPGRSRLPSYAAAVALAAEWAAAPLTRQRSFVGPALALLLLDAARHCPPDERLRGWGFAPRPLRETVDATVAWLAQSRA